MPLEKISNSKATTWRRCPKKYKYKYVMGLRPKKRKRPLEMGSWMHALLEVHYGGGNWKKKHKELTVIYNNYFEEERVDLGDLPTDCKRLMLSYLRTYEREDRYWYPIDQELNEYVTLPSGLRLNVVVDLVVEDHMGIWIVDHKFRSKFSRPGKPSVVLDPQLTLYFWAIERLGYRPLAGAIYNEVRTKAPTVPAKLKSGGLQQRSNIDTDIWTYAAAIKRNGESLAKYEKILRVIASRQRERFFRRTHIPKDSPVVDTTMRELMQTASEINAAERRRSYPRSHESSCDWCDYSDLCVSQFMGGDIQSMIKSNYTLKRGESKEEDDPRREVQGLRTR